MDRPVSLWLVRAARVLWGLVLLIAIQWSDTTRARSGAASPNEAFARVSSAPAGSALAADLDLVTTPPVLSTPAASPTHPPTPNTRTALSHALRPAASSPPTRIRIPKISLDADVVEVGYRMTEEDGETTTSWEVADFAAGFHRGSAYPGHPGNTVIAGHNNIRGRVFRHLVDVTPGDEIRLYVGEQEFLYIVSETLLIKEKGVAEEIQRENAVWIRPTSDERLTLVSCWPFIQPDHRVVVVARPVKM